MKRSRLKNGWILVIVGLSLAVAAIQLLTASKPVSAQEDAYTQHGVTVSPSAACIGDTVTFSGSAQTTYVSVEMYLGEGPTFENDPYGPPYQTLISKAPLSAELGTVLVNNGNWTLTAAVPQTGTDENNQAAAIRPGTYTIMAFAIGFENYFRYLEAGTLEVLNCSNSGIGNMPSTGLPTGALALLAGAGLIAFTGAALGFGKRWA